MSQQIIKLRLYRRRWTLSQNELAGLLGISQSVLSRLEKIEARPDAAVLFGLEVVFGRLPSEFFPGLYAKVEEAVMAAGARLDQRIAHRQDPKANKKRELLHAMARRARGIKDPV